MADGINAELVALLEKHFEKLAWSQQQQSQDVDRKLDWLCANMAKLFEKTDWNAVVMNTSAASTEPDFTQFESEYFFDNTDQGTLCAPYKHVSSRSLTRVAGSEINHIVSGRLRSSALFQRSRSKRLGKGIKRFSWNDLCQCTWHHFEMVCGLLILINAVVLGLQVNYVSTDDYYAQLTVVQHSINLWFAFELAVRVYFSGFKQWASSAQDRWWNFFDLCLVFLWLIELFIVVAGTDGSFLRSIRIFRPCRVLRSLRIFRMVRQILEFRKMIHALFCSFSTLMWSILLLAFEIFFVAVIFVQGVSDMREDGVIDETSDLMTYFGTMGKAYYTLYLCISNGFTWNEVVAPVIDRMHWSYAIMFLLYMSVTLFGVLNVVTAIFVESAMQSAAYHRDVMVANKERAREHYVKHLREIFHEVDTDGSGAISLDEVEAIFASPNINELLECLDITAFDAISLFKLLDADGSHNIDINEFCDGCFRLKGEAKSFDVHCLIYESQRAIRKLNDMRAKLAIHLLAAPRQGCGPGTGRLEKSPASQGFPHVDSAAEFIPSALEFVPRKPWSKYSPSSKDEMEHVLSGVES